MRSVLSLILLSFAALSAPIASARSEPAWQPEAGDVIRFDVLRQGKPFGSHTVTFGAGADGALIAKTKVSLKAGLGPVTLFRYELDASETLKNGKLVSVTGKVNDDGKKRSVTAKREGDVLSVDGSDFKGKAPGDIVAASHWNFAQTKASELLSTEDGEILKVKVTDLGSEQIEAGGKTITADHYRLDSALDVDLWYDDQGRWVKLAFEARGQQIEYVLASPY